MKGITQALEDCKRSLDNLGPCLECGAEWDDGDDNYDGVMSVPSFSHKRGCLYDTLRLFALVLKAVD